MSGYSLKSAAAALKSRQVGSVDLCRAYLDRVAALDGKVNAFLSLDADAVLMAAAESDARRAAGIELSPYDGVPLALKDNIAVAGQPCTCASKILENLVSPYDATVVEKLKKAGLIPFGRLNMDEFAMGSSCENSAFAKTANPWDLNRVPGGSSGGSAAAVAAGMAPVALGSDTGGSIRQPAGFCGVVGMKPTYGRVSRYGLVAFASSLDQIGPLCQNVDDAAAILDIIGGVDSKDSTSLPEPCGGFAAALEQVDDDLSGFKIGLPKEYFEADGLDACVKEQVDSAVETMRGLGAEMVGVSLPHTKYAIATYYIIATAEASANLARFDGVRYGYRDDSAKDLMEMYFKSRGGGFGDEVKRRIILGTYVLSSGYYDAYYLRAQKVRTLIRRDFTEAFKQCDIILTPVTPTVAFGMGEKADPLQMYLADIFTIALNLSGNCGISVPAGIDGASGMPVGVQFIGPALGETELLRTAKVFENNRSAGDIAAPMRKEVAK